MLQETEDSLFASFAQRYELSTDDQTLARYLLRLSSEERQLVVKHILEMADLIRKNREAMEPPTPENKKTAAPAMDAAVSPPVSDSDKPPTATESPPDGVPPGLELDPGIEDKVKKIRAKLYAQTSTRRMFTTSPSTEDASENKKSRP